MLYVRADGNKKIGMGHIMRCLAISGEVLRKNEDVTFLIASDEPADVLKEAGIPYIILDTDYRDMLSERERLSKIFTSGEKILVDSYFVTAQYLEFLKQYGKVFYMDDVHAFAYPADVIINGNIYGDREDYQAVTVLGGCKYSPLRREYQSAKKERKPEKILLTTGSSDPYRLTEKILHAMLQNEVLRACPIDVVCGKFSESYETLLKMEEQFSNIKVYRNVPAMWELMKSAMLAITAGGTTMTELSCMGVPIVCFSFAENQDRVVKTFVEDGYAHFGGFYSKKGEALVAELCQAAQELVLDENLRNSYATKLMELVDGKGCERIADTIVCHN